MSPRFYVMGPYENNDRHSICRDDPARGDPITIITIARIHRPDELYEICELANRAATSALLHEEGRYAD
jgi:hypothetical protein